jgi:hypothetical protein
MGLVWFDRPLGPVPFLLRGFKVVIVVITVSESSVDLMLKSTHMETHDCSKIHTYSAYGRSYNNKLDGLACFSSSFKLPFMPPSKVLRPVPE